VGKPSKDSVPAPARCAKKEARAAFDWVGVGWTGSPARFTSSPKKVTGAVAAGLAASRIAAMARLGRQA
jgi:hypothetical protein